MQKCLSVSRHLYNTGCINEERSTIDVLVVDRNPVVRFLPVTAKLKKLPLVCRGIERAGLHEAVLTGCKLHLTLDDVDPGRGYDFQRAAVGLGEGLHQTTLISSGSDPKHA